MSSFPPECKIDQKDRTNRVVFGVILLIGVLFGVGPFFYFLIGVILIAEGAAGFCGIPLVVEKWQQFQNKKNPPK